MYTKKAVMSARPVIGAAMVAGAFLASAALAAGPEVSVAYPVSTQGLDLSKPAAAHELYARLKHAAWIVCTHGNRVDLLPDANPERCSEGALAAAIRSAKMPLLTQVYLETHLLREAAARGIEVPAQLAAK